MFVCSRSFHLSLNEKVFLFQCKCYIETRFSRCSSQEFSTVAALERSSLIGPRTVWGCKGCNPIRLLTQRHMFCFYASLLRNITAHLRGTCVTFLTYAREKFTPGIYSTALRVTLEEIHSTSSRNLCGFSHVCQRVNYSTALLLDCLLIGKEVSLM